MYIEQIYTGCLAEAAYYIESKGEAAIIDPLRETKPYLELAEKRGAKIKYVLETHFHADFVSGHLDLARKTGATIVYGPNATAAFDIHCAKDGEELKVGDLTIRVLHTPGHTMESSCYLLLDANHKPHSVYTGDTLFIGDVGRPDLAVKSDLSREDLAAHLFESIQTKLMVLPDDVIVYPGHGAGSQCGKKLAEETESTIGMQKKTNYALKINNKDEFVREVTHGLVAPPQYFPKNAVINKTGYESIDTVLERNIHPLTVNEFITEKQKGALILDARDKDIFYKGFIPGSMNISLDGDYAVWVGTLVEDLMEPTLLIVDEGKEEEAVLRLARVGYENVKGFLAGGFDAWIESGMAADKIQSVSAETVKNLMYKQSVNLLDVRRVAEVEESEIENAINLPLAELSKRLGELMPGQEYFVYCQSGYRSSIACSILKDAGFSNVRNILGGIEALEESGVKVLHPVD